MIPQRVVIRTIVFVIALSFLLYFWSDFCLWRADTNLERRNHAAAAQWVARSRWLGRRVDARMCLLQLRVARRLGNFKDVESLLQRAPQLGVSRREIQRERFLAMAQTGQFAAMQAQWQELLQNPQSDGPEIARSYYEWAMLQHNLPLAQKALELWHEDYPHDPEPLALTGRFYQALENWDAAEVAYRQAVALVPSSDEHRLALANVLQVRLKADEAITIYDDYLRKHPDDRSARLGLARCAATKGDLKKAIQLLREATESNPDDFETQKVFGETLLAAGDAPAALEVLEKAYRKVPEHANLAYSLARALKACGRGDEAEPLFAFMAESRPQLDLLWKLEKQLRNEPGNIDLRMKIAGITAKYVSRRDAIRWYENLLQISPHFSPAHEALSDLYRQLGDESRADRHLEQTSQRYSVPNSPADSKASTEASRDVR